LTAVNYSESVDDSVATVREFNRFYTKRIGVVREDFLRTRWSLTEGRLIYELAQHEALPVSALRSALEIDAGQLSRVLGRLEHAEVVRRSTASEDGRRQIVRLTARGRRAFETLDARASQQIGELLASLGEREQRRLLDAMTVIKTTLGKEAPPVVTLRPPEPGDLGWILERHGALYAQEYGWQAPDVEAFIGKIIVDFATRHDPKREAVWIAEVSGERAGCVMCVSKDRWTAQLRLLLVEPHARGMGLGSRLIGQCVDFAREAGYRRMILWTNDPLVDAHRLYERAGFRLVKQAPHRAFGHTMIEQTWQLEL
jgi:DNA-binding MarR family transcriptional regulator/GNAT superfamily N-acetyltransferase